MGESRPKGFSIIRRVKPDAERTCEEKSVVVLAVVEVTVVVGGVVVVRTSRQ